MNRKTFSIIIATYNSGQKIEKTIESILSQDKNLFELIIIDGASTDDTLKWISKYKNDLTCLSEKDTGVYDAFNKAINLATGQYLYFIGAGDCLRDGVLKKVKESLPDDSLSLIYGDIYLVKPQIYQTGERSKSNLLLKPLCHQAIFYHRGIFELIGNYDLRYKIFADGALNLKCFGNDQISKHYVPHVIADYEGGGLSDTTIDYNFRRDLPRLARKHLGLRPSLKAILATDFYCFFFYYKIYHPFFRPFVRPIILSVKNLKDKAVNLVSTNN